MSSPFEKRASNERVLPFKEQDKHVLIAYMGNISWNAGHTKQNLQIGEIFKEKISPINPPHRPSEPTLRELRVKHIVHDKEKKVTIHAILIINRDS